MASLTTLFPDSRYSISIGGVTQLSVLYVYNTNTTSVTNGGICCGWTVPTGATWALFDVWGGGGSGAGACCCQQPFQAGASGSYTRKYTRVNPGEVYTICAAGSGCCSTTCCGVCGYPSYVCNASATYPVCLCASGGCGGQSQCFIANGGCYPSLSCVTGTTCGGSLSMCGHFASDHGGGSCAFEHWHYVPGAPYKSSGVRVSRDSCGLLSGCQMMGDTPPLFPAGAGATSSVHGGACCWGQWGAGGMIKITYR
jgi:hypothetical protein